MRDALLLAERKMVQIGQQERVRENRLAFQAQEEFIGAVEQIVRRKVLAFASALDAHEGVVFEHFVFEPRGEAHRDAHQPPGYHPATSS